MSENKVYEKLSDEHKNIAIEIENKLTGISVREATIILNKVIDSVELDSKVIGFTS